MVTVKLGELGHWELFILRRSSRAVPAAMLSFLRHGILSKILTAQARQSKEASSTDMIGVAISLPGKGNRILRTHQASPKPIGRLFVASDNTYYVLDTPSIGAQCYQAVRRNRKPRQQQRNGAYLGNQPNAYMTLASYSFENASPEIPARLGTISRLNC